jgi:hypothetical protein
MSSWSAVRMNVEVAENSREVRLSYRLPPYLGEHRVGGVEIVAPFACSLDQGPEPRVQGLSVDDHRWTPWRTVLIRQVRVQIPPSWLLTTVDRRHTMAV